MTTVHLSLISHTNVGKTTLARTLLRQDVGQVLDQAHVTEENQAYLLLETEAQRLELWDTPGFGDSARLLRRLKVEKNPVGWFLHQVWDRLADRPLWSSQQAVHNIRHQTDAVLYLVNASERPEDAGYARLELELLEWIGKPVLILLNQTGGVAPGSREARELEQAWREHGAPWSVVKGVLSLDAFTRCWAQEGYLLRRLATVLEGSKSEAMEHLAHAWRERNLEVFRSATERMATYLARAASDHQALSGSRASRSEKKQAMTALGERLETETQRLTDALIAEHGLSGRSSGALEKRLEHFLVQGTTDLTTEKGAILGGAVSGALGGLAADMLSGGLTFGGGLVAGAILGALGGAGLSRAHELIRLGGEPVVSWSPEFLDELTRQTVLRYLAVAHFGRGRGNFEDQEHPEHWQEAVSRTFPENAELRRCWKALASTGRTLDPTETEKLGQLVRQRLTRLLAEAYPEAEISSS